MFLVFFAFFLLKMKMGAETPILSVIVDQRIMMPAFLHPIKVSSSQMLD